jgi:hypothetical protein
VIAIEVLVLVGGSGWALWRLWDLTLPERSLGCMSCNSRRLRWHNRSVPIVHSITVRLVICSDISFAAGTFSS